MPKPSILPLSTPIIAGPRELAVVVNISNNSSKNIADINLIYLIILVLVSKEVLAFCWAIYLKNLCERLALI